MSIAFHTVTGLPPPLHQLDEIVTDTDETGGIEVQALGLDRLVVILESDWECTLGGQVSVVGPGMAVAVPKGTPVTYRATRKRMRRLHAVRMYFSRERPEAVGEKGGLAADFSGPMDDFARYYFRAPRFFPTVRADALAMFLEDYRREAQARTLAFAYAAGAAGARLLVELVRGLEAGRGDHDLSPERHEALVVEVRNYLACHFARSFTLDEVARSAGVSAEHIARVFRRVTGSTVFGEVARLRMQHAKGMLALGRASVAEVAKQTGFATASSFVRAFKAAEGTTPRRYREGLLGELTVGVPANRRARAKIVSE